MRAVICSKFGSPEDLEVKEDEQDSALGSIGLKPKIVH